jgi:hypothetical protein
MHPNDYLQRELLDKNGTAFGLEGIRRQANGEIESVPVLHKNQEYIEAYAQLILDRLKTKSEKNYPEKTTLVVQCFLNTVYDSSEWEMLKNALKSENFQSQFREVFICDVNSAYFFSL